MHLKATGTAFLCFAEDDSAFQGIFKTEFDETFSLAGTLGKLPNRNFHECCFDTIPTFYTIEIAQSVDGELVTKFYSLEHVMRTGGDNCLLNFEDKFEFNTEKLLVGSKAEEFIEKYFPARFLKKNCYVCIGDMTFDYIFPDDVSLDDM